MSLQDDCSALSPACVCANQARDEFANRFRIVPDGTQGKVPKRVIYTGGLAKKDRITRRCEMKAVSDIDADVKKWLAIAYELDA